MNGVLGIILTIFVLIFPFIAYVSTKRIKCNGEGYDEYDYERENPNALISGELIGGTVYAKYPDNVPGLGWIL